MRGWSAAAYDDWVVNGSWHTCVCGARWSDSDGGPCHEECRDCGKPTDEADEKGRCPECAEAAKAEEELEEEECPEQPQSQTLSS